MKKTRRRSLGRARQSALVERLRAIEETLEILSDKRLFKRLLLSSKTIKLRARAGLLHLQDAVMS
jgi:hypothetical protein